MTQFYASWALILLGWLAFTTRIWIWDGEKVHAETREFDARNRT